MISGRAAGDRDAAHPRQRLPRPCARAKSSEVTSTAAAPSVSGEEVPAVTVPSLSNAGFSSASPAERGLRPDAAVRSTVAALPRIGTISAASCPAACAAAALRWLRVREFLLVAAGDLVLAGQILGCLAHRHVGLRVVAARGRGGASG